jgi:hypothetical protein
MAAAIVTGHPEDCGSNGRGATETGHSMCSDGKPAMSDRSGADRTGTPDPKRK